MTIFAGGCKDRWYEVSAQYSLVSMELQRNLMLLDIEVGSSLL